MNLYFIDECIFVVAESEKQALAICTEAYGDSPDEEGYLIERINAKRMCGMTIGDETGNIISINDLFAKATEPCVLVEIEP